ncbi:MAG: hypothetical protein H6736_22515 [Alphaproteobacteria bacterium]|nr:hypothetical protein [Alphaproteobacteria bacterium]MCB9694593.1 hypothetical protein [Alphaproteobacteria bacterium]
MSWSTVDSTPSPHGHRWCAVGPDLAEALAVEETVSLTCRGPRGSVTAELPGGVRPPGLDAAGIVEVGTVVAPGDVLVGRVQRRVSSTAEERIRAAVLNTPVDPFEDVSLRAPGSRTVGGPPARVSAAEPVLDSAEVLVGASITLAFRRPLSVGDVLEDRSGRRATVVALRDQEGLQAWDGGEVEVARAISVDDVLHARSVGPYTEVGDAPTRTREDSGGAPVPAALRASLVQAGAPWTAWELATLKCDVGRAQAYEQVLRGDWPHVAATQVPTSVLIGRRALLAAGLMGGFGARGAVLRWADTETLRAFSSGRVVSADTLDMHRNPVPGGLCCERIFGPVKDYACACGALQGLMHRGAVCGTCGVEVGSSTVRRERFGHVELAMPVPHPWRLDEVAEALGITREEVDALLTNAAELGGSGVVEAGGTWEAGPPALVARLAGSGLLLEVLPVLPAGLRIFGVGAVGQAVPDGLTDLYRRLVNRNGRLARLTTMDAPAVIKRNEYRMVFDAVKAVFDNAGTPGAEPLTGPDRTRLRAVADILTDHLGPPLLDRAVDFSATASLVLDPDLPDGTCSVPRVVLETVFRPWLYGLLQAWRCTTTVTGAKSMVDQRHPRALQALDALLAAWPVLLATSGSLAGCRAVVAPEGSAAIAVGSALAGLDGETVALHVPLTRSAFEEVQGLVGRVVPAVDRPVVTGWLTALARGAPPVPTLAKATEPRDPVEDPAVRSALGWLPGDPPQPGSWAAAIPLPPG